MILGVVLMIAWGAFVVLGLANGYHSYYLAIAAGLSAAIYFVAGGTDPRSDVGEDDPGPEGPWPDRAAVPELLRRRRDRRGSR